ncbi:MAG: GNAT family N-acetyltransferase [Cyclobacteriaceae bacterium]|nr:GNAT family N-acetyltransferase [Cyclobacteriaceae bacterium]
MTLETERLVLEPVSLEKLETLRGIITNPFVRKYLFDDEILSNEQVGEFISISNQLFSDKGYGLWLIKLKDHNGIIGFTGLWHFYNENQPQLLYALLPSHTKSGYAKEASLKLLDYVWANLGFDYIDAACDTPNSASLHTAVSIGMTKTSEKYIDGKPVSFFRIYRNEHKADQ